MSRDRVPTRPADPGPTDESDDDDDSESDDSETRRRRRSDQAGDVRDLRRQQVGQGARETALGSSTNLRIAPEFDPGFVDTEFINRIAFTDSFQFLWDTKRGHWRPLTEKDLAGSAFASGLLADTITDALGNVLGTTSGTETDSNGNLRLGSGLQDGTDLTTSTSNTTTLAERRGIVFEATSGISQVTATIPPTDTLPTRAYLTDDSGDTVLDEQPITDRFTKLTHSFTQGTYYRVVVDRESKSYSSVTWTNQSFPISTTAGAVTGGETPSSSSGSDVYNIEEFGTEPPGSNGTATTAFGSPSRSSGYDTAIYNQQLKGGSVRVDLYAGDPDSPDSTLLKQDIQERTDLSDVNPQRSNLQYKITMERAPDGSSPVVDTAGYQYQK